MNPISQSCIRTRVKVPATTVVRFLQRMFPELGADARITQPYSIENSIGFVVEHTEQPPIEVGPIVLETPKVGEPFSPEEEEDIQF